MRRRRSAEGLLLSGLTALAVLAAALWARPVAADSEDPGPLADLGGSPAAAQLSCADWSRRVARFQQRAIRRAEPSPDLRDLRYGPQPLQTLDVYRPRPGAAAAAPLIVMVHGGGWCIGDKALPSVTGAKLQRWVARGFVFVSVNHPMVAEGSDALAQARHVARAVAFVQAQAAAWGGDPARVILIGHSAGAHLVSLVNASEPMRRAAGIGRLLGTVSLDAGALDVAVQMPRVYPFLRQRYLEAFGSSESGWAAASPTQQLGAGAAPWLGVCSTTRRDDPCGQAEAYAARSRGLGIEAVVLPLALSHGDINSDLGRPGAYTEAVERFLAGLDSEVARRLQAAR